MATTVSRPIIGIVPSFDDGRVIEAGGPGIQRVYLRRDYLYSIAQVGAVPLILSPEMDIEHVLELCDGIVISGGADIEPQFYNEQPIKELRMTEPAERFEWEKQLIEACDEYHVPILGICYGLQRLNVHYGGSLVQDIPQELGHNVGHDGTEHEVLFVEDFLGIDAAEARTIASRHHQAIGRLGQGVVVCARSKDGIAEAAKVGERHFGMQWHPESDETGVHMYRAFVERCMEK
jgi:putative glutamine amidotransferase